MTWQLITRCISDDRFEVESKAGNRYPAQTEYDYMADGIYKQIINRAHDDKEYWAWVSFDQDTPTIEDYKRKPEGHGPPQKPPWEV